MQIERLEVCNFRNFSSLKMEFSPGINMLYGENGQGKTNILEGIYMCSLGRSHRKSKESEQIRFNQEDAHIKGEFKTKNSPVRVDIHLKKNSTKGVAINRLPIKRISELFGCVKMVIFSPEDLNIIKGTPSERRAFINAELCQIDPIYVDNLIKYTHLVKGRNELLKGADEKRKNIKETLETLDVIDLQIVEYGKKIIKKRREFLEKINGVFKDIDKEITEDKESAEIFYEPSVLEEDFYDRLLGARERDSILKTTSIGPHRDDFSFYDGKKNLKTYGSQGQQRTCVLSLKLAELKMITESSNETPILLLDDVLSELDRTRQIGLLENIKGVQTIITGTGLDEFMEGKISGAKKFKVCDSKVTECE